MVMLTRFRIPQVNGNNPHPMNFPQHPYWVFNPEEDLGYYIVVTYAENNDMEYVVSNWPEAQGLDILERADDYEFSSSLKKPAWWF